MADEAERTGEEPSLDDEMIFNSQQAGKVGTTLATPGWTDVIRPAMDNRRQFYLDALLSRQERMEDVIFAQQSVLAIDEMLSMIEHILGEGKRAEDYFKEKHGAKQQDEY